MCCEALRAACPGRRCAPPTAAPAAAAPLPQLPRPTPCSPLTCLCTQPNPLPSPPASVDALLKETGDIIAGGAMLHSAPAHRRRQTEAVASWRCGPGGSAAAARSRPALKAPPCLAWSPPAHTPFRPTPPCPHGAAAAYMGLPPEAFAADLDLLVGEASLPRWRALLQVGSGGAARCAGRCRVAGSRAPSVADDVGRSVPDQLLLLLQGAYPSLARPLLHPHLPTCPPGRGLREPPLCAAPRRRSAACRRSWPSAGRPTRPWRQRATRRAPTASCRRAGCRLGRRQKRPQPEAGWAAARGTRCWAAGGAGSSGGPSLGARPYCPHHLLLLQMVPLLLPPVLCMCWTSCARTGARCRSSCA